MCIASVPKAKKATPSVHGEKKKQYQFMLTPSASEALDRLAETAEVTRSECIERLIRTGNAQSIKDY